MQEYHWYELQSDLCTPRHFVKQGESEAVIAHHCELLPTCTAGKSGHTQACLTCCRAETGTHTGWPQPLLQRAFLPPCPPVASLPHGWWLRAAEGRAAGWELCRALCPLQLPTQKSHTSDAHKLTISCRFQLNTEIHCRCTVSQSSSLQFQDRPHSSPAPFWYWLHWPSQTRQTRRKNTQANWNCFKWINSWSDPKSKAGVRNKHKTETLFSTAIHLDGVKWSMKLYPEDSPTMFGRGHPFTSHTVYIYPSLLQLNFYSLGFLHS